ncbi:Interferon-induced transmembrane protein [Algoriella xinjiangensis]|uniref:Interferon-induced transmembrane protein n=1 Tax=Algoriella xinjiangensis TaxID=684065 RepID=A0A1I4YJQ5_9FLAO|nr:CD225/dispanin family protein [Algoriella xinjiangensis]SFN38308.1 Interferon-induced transmembrane protein [Algoriella xinjiangensis]VDH17389.1 Interferon-induced transmembrane protein [Algoriella xinjiangensis]
MDSLNQPIQEFNQSTDSTFDNIPQKPENNLVIAIVSTVLGLCSPCCIGLILGVIAIVFANQVNSKFNLGDYSGALQAAKNSKLLSYIALGITALYLVYIVFIVVTQGTDAFLEQYQGILDNSGNLDD